MSAIDRSDLSAGLPPIRFSNSSGSIIPARSYAKVTGISGTLFTIDQCDVDVIDPAMLVVTGASEIPISGKGTGYPFRYPRWVKYNSTAPSNGDYFGPVNGQWYGQKNYPAFLVWAVSGDYAAVVDAVFPFVMEAVADESSSEIETKHIWRNGTLVTPQLTLSTLDP